MNTSIRTQRSTAYVKPINQRGRAWKPDPITNQFRFIIRMAYACHEGNVPYVLTWGFVDGVMSATILVTGNIPMPKPLPKAPRFALTQTKQGADTVPPSSLDQAREFARRSKAENTLRGYRSDWTEFCGWCETHGVWQSRSILLTASMRACTSKSAGSTSGFKYVARTAATRCFCVFTAARGLPGCA